MRTLGYIVSERKLTFEYGFIQQIKSADEAKPGFPVLYVGWEKMKKDPSYKSILDWQLSDDKFWTFSRSENRSRFEKDLKRFSEYCVTRIASKVKYKYVNVFTIGYSRLKSLVEIINGNCNETVYVSGDAMAYIPYGEYTLGISFEILSYCGIGKRKAFDWLSKRRPVLTDRDTVQERKVLNDMKYAIPHVYWRKTQAT